MRRTFLAISRFPVRVFAVACEKTFRYTIDVDPVAGPFYNAGLQTSRHGCLPMPSDARHSGSFSGQTGFAAQCLIAQDICLRSIRRPVTTRFFGKSVNTGKMTRRLPICLSAWIFAATLLCPMACGQRTDPVVGGAGAPTAVPVAKGPATDDVTHAQKRTNDQATPTPDPRALLEDAMRVLEMRRSVSAKIRQQVDLFGKSLVGSGSYFEKRLGTDRLIRLELRIQHGDQASSLVQVAAVADSNARRFLWTKRKLLDKEQLSRVDLDRVARVLQREEVTPGAGRMGILPGMGGLTKMLRGLHASFDFTDAQLGWLGKERQLVWRIQGQWKPDRLAKLLPKSQKEAEAGKLPDPSRLPPHLPDQVVLHLGHEDLFPYRIEYRRSNPKESDGSAKLATRAMVTMEFYDVVVDISVSSQRFTYNPGDLDYTDDTDAYLESLGVER